MVTFSETVRHCRLALKGLAEFRVWCPDLGDSVLDARIFIAPSPEDAVRAWAEWSDAQGEYDLVSWGKSALVIVYYTADLTERRFRVFAEMTPTYTITEDK